MLLDNTIMLQSNVSILIESRGEGFEAKHTFNYSFLFNQRLLKWNEVVFDNLIYLIKLDIYSLTHLYTFVDHFFCHFNQDYRWLRRGKRINSGWERWIWLGTKLGISALLEIVVVNHLYLL